MKKALAMTATFAVALVTIMAISTFAVTPVVASDASNATFNIQAPLSDRNVFYGGSVMSIKFTLTDSNGNFITDATATITISPGPTTPAGQKNVDSLFALDGHTYTYKLDTKPLAAGPGSPSYTITIVVDFPDGSSLTETFGPIAFH